MIEIMIVPLAFVFVGFVTYVWGIIYIKNKKHEK
jgi:hypothetical protein